ncbi:MAG: hypothetical protein ACI8RU_000356 [Zhongshania aliphaticivorans]|jgi:hypothetical protein
MTIVSYTQCRKCGKKLHEADTIRMSDYGRKCASESECSKRILKKTSLGGNAKET